MSQTTHSTKAIRYADQHVRDVTQRPFGIVFHALAAAYDAGADAALDATGKPPPILDFPVPHEAAHAGAPRAATTSPVPEAVRAVKAPVEP